MKFDILAIHYETVEREWTFKKLISHLVIIYQLTLSVLILLISLSVIRDSGYDIISSLKLMTKYAIKVTKIFSKFLSKRFI